MRQLSWGSSYGTEVGAGVVVVVNSGATVGGGVQTPQVTGHFAFIICGCDSHNDAHDGHVRILSMQAGSAGSFDTTTPPSDEPQVPQAILQF